uniref:Uncharacterized protein n=1 Tax=Alexandrium catenella TaxID=2925 RepID=A0A7S1M3Z4_ALECA
MAASRMALPLLAAAVFPCSSLLFDANAEPSVASIPLRHLYVAGTMGTGLEFFQHVMRECVETRVCEMRESSFYTSMVYQSDDEEALKKVWAHNRPKNGGLVPVNLLSPSERFTDELFLHPFSGEGLRGNVDPNLSLYEKVARSLGDSFKVMVLTRSNEHDLLSYVMRTRKLSAEEAEKEEAANIRKLAAQVRTLPKRAVRCQRYEDLLSYGPHMSPMLNKQSWEGNDSVEEAHKASAAANHGCKKPNGKKCPEAPMLREALDELETLCHPGDASTRGVALNEEVQRSESTYASKVRWMLE